MYRTWLSTHYYFLATGILLFSTSVALAADNNWNVSVGDWSDTNPCPWDTGIEPDTSTIAYIQNSGTANLTHNGEVCKSLYVGGSDTGTVQMNGGSLSMENLYDGYLGTGTFTQFDGTNTVSSTLYIGNHGGNGIYNLMGGTLITKSISIYSASFGNTFNFGGGTLEASGNFSTGLLITFTGTGSNSTIDTSGYLIKLYGDMSGSGSLNKDGTGTLQLIGNNVSYSGDINVNAGTLEILKKGYTGLVTINNGGRFGGSGFGSISQIIVNSGGHIYARAYQPDIGTLSLTGNLTLNSGAVLEYDLSRNYLGSDKISLTSSTLFLHGQQFSDFIFTPDSSFGPGIYTLIDAGDIQGSLGGNLTGTIKGLQSSLSISGNDIILSVVPEPATMALLSAGLLCLFIGNLYNRKRYLPGFYC
ncbi:MAG: autotransporter-associated beta strand repeat-containing protein [Thermoguttaceae bacterium]|jgi:autotransporter-associated beta strand protein